MNAAIRALLLCLLLVTTAVAVSQTQRLVINEVVANNLSSLADRHREHDDWVEIYNPGDEAVQMAGMYLSDDVENPGKWQVPSEMRHLTTVQPNSFLILWFDGSPEQGAHHASFKLSAKGDVLVLVDTDGKTLIDSVHFGAMRPNMAYGYAGSGTGKRGYFETTTPRKPNPGTNYSGITAVPQLTVSDGYHAAPITVEASNFGVATVYFTTDGSAPGATNGQQYVEPITVSSTTVVRMVAIEPGKLPSNVVTETYLLGEPHHFPVVSLATDHLDYFTGSDPKKNIFTETPLSVQFFEPDGKPAFSEEAGMRLVGKAIRNYPQKSIAVHLRGSYGKKKLDYPLFSDKPHTEYYAFLLRNSGNDWGKTLFKDALMHRLVMHTTDVDVQAYKPVVVYINGTYWGIHNLREKLCSHYFATNHPEVNDNNIDFLEFTSAPLKGDMNHFNALEKLAIEADLSIDTNYAKVANQLDLDNFIDYQIAEIFYANTDWPMANMKYWRERTENGKWRWILFDTDLAFDRDKQRCKGHHRSLDYALGENNCHLPHLTQPLHNCTHLLRNMMVNEGFRNQFVNRFADLMNTAFSAQTMTDTIRAMQRRLDPEMDRHIERWGQKGGIRNRGAWNSEINKLIRFATERPDTMRQMIVERFELTGTHPITIDVAGPGKIQINSIVPTSYPWTGTYFRGVPVEVVPVPDEGRKFVGWEGVKKAKAEKLVLWDTRNGEQWNVKAVFK